MKKGFSLTQRLMILLLILPGSFDCKKVNMSEQKSLPVRVDFLGAKINEAGFRAESEITYEEQNEKRWPYLSVVIYDSGGEVVYKSQSYAAWFSIKICWDRAGRLWIQSSDTGVDVAAPDQKEWKRYIWRSEATNKTVFNSSGEPVEVVAWEPPEVLDIP